MTGCDVLVIGGGSAGVAAAVAAARHGARTILLERHGALGGMASASLIHSICGLYLLRDEPEALLANDGFAAEFAQRVTDSGGAWGPVRMGRVDVLLQHPTAFARMCDACVAESPSLETRLHTEVIGVRGGERVEEVDTICRGVRETITPSAVVDASGDGVVAALMPLPFEMTELARLQRPAFVFTLNGVDDETLAGDGRLRLAQRIAAAVHDGDLPRGALGTAMRASGRNGETFVTIDLDVPPAFAEAGGTYDPTEPACLTALEMYGRELADTLARFLDAEVNGFHGCRIASFPTRVGVRESRRLIGEYRIEADDLIRGATFEDSIGLATWPMEMREKATGPKLRYPESNRPCEIPLRALRVRDAGNLFVAGRCLSTSHEAQASLRVIGTCLVTGEAAGFAAALLAQRTDVTAQSVRAAREAHRQYTPAGTRLP